VTDQPPTEEHDPYRWDEEPLPPPPDQWTPAPEDTRVVIRDQTTPREGAAVLLQRQMDDLAEHERRGRLPSGEVRAIVGQAAGTIEALEDQASRLPEALQEIEYLTAQLAEAQGGDDAQALRLWRAGKMAEVQAASERTYASARRHAESMVQDARAYCTQLVEEAERRAQSADPSFPAAPEIPEDRIARAVTRARYLDDVRRWLAEQDQDVDSALDALGAELEEARKLRGIQGHRIEVIGPNE
jgi:hypothetical protein